MDWVQNGVIGRSRTPGDNFGHFLKISSPAGKEEGKKFFNEFCRKMTNKTYVHFVSKCINCRYKTTN